MGGQKSTDKVACKSKDQEKALDARRRRRSWKNTGVSGRGESFHHHVALRWHFCRYPGSLHRTQSCGPEQQQQSSPSTPHSQSSCQLIRYQHTSRDSEIALGAQPCHAGGMRKKPAWFAFWAVDWNSLTDSTGASSSVPTHPTKVQRGLC